MDGWMGTGGDLFGIQHMTGPTNDLFKLFSKRVICGIARDCKEKKRKEKKEAVFNSLLYLTETCCYMKAASCLSTHS